VAAEPVAEARRRGPRPRTNAREIASAGLRLFAEHGFAETTIDQIAAAAGVSRTTFFRYFGSKSDILWAEFDAEADSLRAALAAAPAGRASMEAVRQAVLAVYARPGSIPELRARWRLISSAPELSASAAAHYDGWVRAISDFIARRTGAPADALVPVAVGRATLAVCTAAYEKWSRDPAADFNAYLDQALRALAGGFADP
jgi:mycofactocin system transcriptional regulator